MDLWSVLGIEPTDDASELKRAYARQVKVHSPEADPEGFQRLRRAYERLLERVHSAKPALGDGPDDAPDEPPGEPEPEPAPPRPAWPRAEEIAARERNDGRAPASQSAAEQAETLARSVFSALVEQGEEAALAALRDALRSNESLEVEDRLAFLAVGEIQRFPATFWPARFVAGVREAFALKQRAVASHALVEFLDYCRVRDEQSALPSSDVCRREIARLVALLEARGDAEARQLLDALIAEYHAHDGYKKAFESSLLEAIPRLTLGRWPRTLMARIAEILGLHEPRTLRPDRARWLAPFSERLATSLYCEKLEEAARGGAAPEAIAARLFLLPPRALAEHLALPPGPVRESVRARLRAIEVGHPHFWSHEWKPEARRAHLERIARHVRPLSAAEAAKVSASARAWVRRATFALALSYVAFLAIPALLFFRFIFGDLSKASSTPSVLEASPYFLLLNFPAWVVSLIAIAGYWLGRTYLTPRLRLLGAIASHEGLDRVTRPLRTDVPFGKARPSFFGVACGVPLLGTAATIALGVATDGARFEPVVWGVILSFALLGVLLLCAAFFRRTPTHARKRFRMRLQLGPLFAPLLPAGLSTLFFYLVYEFGARLPGSFCGALILGGLFGYGFSLLIATSACAPCCRGCGKSLRGLTGAFASDARARLKAALAGNDLDAIVRELGSSASVKTLRIRFGYCGRCKSAIWATGPGIDAVIEGDAVSRLVEALRA